MQEVLEHRWRMLVARQGESHPLHSQTLRRWQDWQPHLHIDCVIDPHDWVGRRGGGRRRTRLEGRHGDGRRVDARRSGSLRGQSLRGQSLRGQGGRRGGAEKVSDSNYFDEAVRHTRIVSMIVSMPTGGGTLGIEEQHVYSHVERVLTKSQVICPK